MTTVLSIEIDNVMALISEYGYSIGLYRDKDTNQDYYMLESKNSIRVVPTNILVSKRAVKRLLATGFIVYDSYMQAFSPEFVRKQTKSQIRLQFEHRKALELLLQVAEEADSNSLDCINEIIDFLNSLDLPAVELQPNLISFAHMTLNEKTRAR